MSALIIMVNLSFDIFVKMLTENSDPNVFISVMLLSSTVHNDFYRSNINYIFEKMPVNC